MNMSTSMMDSKPVFRARALAVGLKEVTVDLLESKGVDTLSTLAFLCGIQPGTADDDAFVKSVASLLDCTDVNPVPIIIMAQMRRMWFEANTDNS
jgi:hypothetical protein